MTTNPTPNSDCWELRHVSFTSSTNDLVRALPAWHAVAADSQQAGRGRHGRRFSSAPGGIWLSAVLPMPGGPQKWQGLALAIGWGLLGWLSQLSGLRAEARLAARLRWPNDLMIGNRKLGGILLEQSSTEACIVGVGINVHNDPAAEDPELAGVTTRLADWLPDCPPAKELIAGVLDGIRNGWQHMARVGLAGMCAELNSCWGGSRDVEIHPVDGRPLVGTMQGIDEQGAIVVRFPEGGGAAFPAHMVERMIEILPGM